MPFTCTTSLALKHLDQNSESLLALLLWYFADKKPAEDVSLNLTGCKGNTEVTYSIRIWCRTNGISARYRRFQPWVTIKAAHL